MMQKARFLNVEEGFTIRPILPHSRLHWGKLAQLYASCMASIPILLTGLWLAANFSFIGIALIIFVSALVVLTFDFANSALGADTGLPASILAQGCFGSFLSKIVVSVPLILIGWGWFGVQLALAIKSLLVIFGIEGLMSSPNSPLMSLLLTLLVGTLFAFAPISRKLVRYGLTNISILLLSIFCLIFLIKSFEPFHFQGWIDFIHQAHVSDPRFPLSFGSAVLVGVCASQFVMISDYSRFARRIYPDSLLIPLSGVTLAQVLFCGTAAIAGLIISLQPDFFVSLVQAGVPRWAFLLLFLSQWNAARLVVIYSAGLAGASLIENTSSKARYWITLLSVIIGTLLVVFNIYKYFIDFLVIQAMVFPSIGAILLADHFFVKRRHWSIREKVNLKALCSLLAGWIVGILIFIYLPSCYAFLGSAITALFLYLLLNFRRRRDRLKSVGLLKKPPRNFVGVWQRYLLYLNLLCLGGATFSPVFFPTLFGDLLVLLSVAIMSISVIMYFSKITDLAIEDIGPRLEESSWEANENPPLSRN